MDHQVLISKTAFSKGNKKLGLIVEIRGSETAKVQITEKHAYISHLSIFRDEAIIPLPISHIIRVEEDNVYFNITLKDFKLKVKGFHFEKKTFKDSRKEKFDRRVRKGLDRGYYYKKEKGEW